MKFVRKVKVNAFLVLAVLFCASTSAPACPEHVAQRTPAAEQSKTKKKKKAKKAKAKLGKAASAKKQKSVKKTARASTPRREARHKSHAPANPDTGPAEMPHEQKDDLPPPQNTEPSVDE